MKYNISADKVMSKKPVTIDAAKTLHDAGKAMMEKGVGSLIAVDNGKLAGILTEKDLVRVLANECKDPKATKVREAMTKKVISVSPNTDLYDIARMMTEKKVRRLPVVDSNKLVGIVTEKDLLRIQPSIIDVLVEKVRVKGPHYPARPLEEDD
ncbi:MAG: CBS domain-containing protein [Candidatus Aenigmarchaeota archaeon]|nr:CBS domain-containing protein [Candidatus Aenigmarchaeota archaeon]